MTASPNAGGANMDARRAFRPLAYALLVAALCVALTPGCRLTDGGRASDVSGDPIAEWRTRWATKAQPEPGAPQVPAAVLAAISAARERLAAQDDPGARESLDQAAQQHAEDAAALARIAEVYLEIDPARGQELLRAAIKLDRRNADHRLALAANLEEIGQSEAALAELKAAVEAIPDSRDLRLAYATALIRTGDGAAADRVLTAPADLWSDLAAETWEQATEAQSGGEQGLSGARRLLDRALGQIAQRHRLLASAAVLQGDLQRAADEYEQSVDARRNWAAQLRLADLRVALGEEDAAKQAYLDIAPRQARLARARLERWDAVGFEAFSAEMKRFISEHAQEYTTIGAPPAWRTPGP